MAKAKVCLVDKEYKADYKVFFVEQSHKEKNHQILQGGVLVAKDHQATVKLFVVNQDYKADICIMHKNFPKAS